MVIKTKSGFYLAKDGLFSLNSISHEQLIVVSSLTPHCNRNMHFPVSDSHNVCPLDQYKWLKRLN